MGCRVDPRSRGRRRARALRLTQAPHERAFHQRADAGAASRRRDGAALSLSAALVLDAAAGAHLLAGGAALRVGLSAALHRAECRLLRPRRRRVHRRGADVGHPVSRPARLLGLVSRGDVVAQPRQPDDQPAASDRVRLRADDHEHDPARDRHGAGDVARHRLLRLQRLQAGPRARGVLPQPDPDQLGGRHRRLGRGDAQRHGRGVARLDPDVRAHAAHLRLLPGERAAGLAAGGSPGRCRRPMCSRACGR